jgi:hypothetical protein
MLLPPSDLFESTVQVHRLFGSPSPDFVGVDPGGSTVN